MKLSIAGTGKIVREVMEMLRREFSGQIEVTGIYARPQSLAKAEALCRDTGHPEARIFTDYEQMLRECPADMVYVANANHVHFPYALRALKTGHHTIVEKPVTTCRAHTEQLIDAAMARGLRCMPAFSLLYMPLYRKIQEEMLPQIGPVHAVLANYSQYSSRYDQYKRGEIAPVFDPQQAGGALADLNIYNLCFVIGLFGKPRSAYYMAHRGYNGIDLSGTVALRYPGFTASLTAAKDCDGHNFGSIHGEKGHIEVVGGVSTMARVRLCLRGEEPVEYHTDPARHRLSYEFEQFRLMTDQPGASTLNIPMLCSVAQFIDATAEQLQPLS